MTALSATRVSRRPQATPGRPRGLPLVVGAEALSSVLGFVALIHVARTLGPRPFAGLEYATAVAAWLLVVVRGGADTIAYREAARRPRLIRQWTGLLIGLRLVAAGFGYLGVLALSTLAGRGVGPVVALAGLQLFTSALAADVGPRATGRLGRVALAQVLRTSGWLVSAILLVRDPGHSLRAAACLVTSELLASILYLAVHVRDHGRIGPLWRRRASLVLARRGAVAGLGRFLRVSVYGLDLLVLGQFAEPPGIGPYSAGRRLVFALLALALAVPATLGPSLALGRGDERLRHAVRLVWSAVLPATLGLILVADRLMPWTFGPGFRGGGPWLALVALRLPFQAVSAVGQAGLVAWRREGLSLRISAAQAFLALPAVVIAAQSAGPWGVGWALLGVEAFGAAASWVSLERVGAAGSSAWLPSRATFAGSLALAVACFLLSAAPALASCVAGVLVYATVWQLAGGNHEGAH